MINPDACQAINFSFVRHAGVSITDANISLSGQKAFKLVSVVAVLSDEQLSALENVASPAHDYNNLKELWDSLSPMDALLCRTSGLLYLDGKNLLFLFAETIRGASGPALGEKASTARNVAANEALKASMASNIDSIALFANKAEFALQCAIARYNDTLLAAHKPKMPSFVLTMLNNQKVRSFGSSSVEIDKYNALANKVEQTEAGWSQFLETASEIEVILVNRVNDRLKKDLKTHIAKTMNADKYREDYRETIHTLINNLPKAPISTPSSDTAVISLSKLSPNW
jgi:hypothetical protein